MAERCFEHDGHVGVELVDEDRGLLGAYHLETVREFPQRLVAHVLVRIGAVFLDRLRRQQGHAGAMGREHLDDFRLAARVGPKDILAELRVSVVVHAEVDGYDSRFQRQYVARQAGVNGFLDHLLLFIVFRGEQLSFVGMGALAEPGGVAAPTDVPEREFLVRKTRQGKGFDVGGVQLLFRNAVTQEYHAIATVEEEARILRAGRRRQHGPNQATCQHFSRHELPPFSFGVVIHGVLEFVVATGIPGRWLTGHEFGCRSRHCQVPIQELRRLFQNRARRLEAYATCPILK